MADLGWVTRATGERHRVQASDLPTGRFDELRKAIQRKEAVLRCVNEQCRGGMHCRRWGAMQLPDLCPECQDGDRRVRMHIDTDRWIYCGFCGWEPGRKELA